MPHFTFFMHDGPSKMPSFEIDFFESPELATEHAGHLLARNPRYTTVEVAGEDGDISRVERGLAADRRAQAGVSSQPGA
jgi:hypothetical protein